MGDKWNKTEICLKFEMQWAGSHEGTVGIVEGAVKHSETKHYLNLSLVRLLERQETEHYDIHFQLTVTTCIIVRGHTTLQMELESSNPYYKNIQQTIGTSRGILVRAIPALSFTIARQLQGNAVSKGGALEGSRRTVLDTGTSDLV